MKKTTRSMLLLAIEGWLDERRESNGGYAEITSEDIHELDNIIRMLVELKCETDPDGDRPIEWRLLNRNTHRRVGCFGFLPVRYPHLETDEEQAADSLSRGGILDTLLSEQRAIADAIDCYVRCRQHKFFEEEKAAKEA